MHSDSSRLSVIDGFKVLASQVIVLHHLSAYGPLADALYRLFPALSEWLFDYGRMAVQVFLVTGGFLAARSLAPHGWWNRDSVLMLLGRRYVRLVVPLLGAILLSIVCAAIARQFFQDDFIPDAPTLWQLLAHLFLLQDVVKVSALSAGVWYVAIDFQLYVLTALCLWGARRLGRNGRWVQFLGLASVFVWAVLSFYVFNCDADWDVVAPYHFGAYALGLGCYWLIHERKLPCFWLGVGLVVVACALYVDFRTRLALALVCALCIGVAMRAQFWPQIAQDKVQRLSRESYSLFLVHFPLCLLANAFYAYCEPQFSGLGTVLFVGGVWWCSMRLARWFHAAVDVRSEALFCGLMEGCRLLAARIWRLLVGQHGGLATRSVSHSLPPDLLERNRSLYGSPAIARRWGQHGALNRRPVSREI